MVALVRLVVVSNAVSMGINGRDVEIKNMKIERKERRVRITEIDKLCGVFVVEQGFVTIEQLWKIAWNCEIVARINCHAKVWVNYLHFLEEIKFRW